MEDKNYENFQRGQEYRKVFSIAFFNATNAAIEIEKSNPSGNDDDARKNISKWRDWFLDQHVRYYVDNIAPVGMEEFTPGVVKGLDKAKEEFEGKNK